MCGGPCIPSSWWQVERALCVAGDFDLVRISLTGSVTWLDDVMVVAVIDWVQAKVRDLVVDGMDTIDERVGARLWPLLPCSRVGSEWEHDRSRRATRLG